jgi:hypothetical protein
VGPAYRQQREGGGLGWERELGWLGWAAREKRKGEERKSWARPKERREEKKKKRRAFWIKRDATQLNLNLKFKFNCK